MRRFRIVSGLRVGDAVARQREKKRAAVAGEGQRIEVRRRVELRTNDRDGRIDRNFHQGRKSVVVQNDCVQRVAGGAPADPVHATVEPGRDRSMRTGERDRRIARREIRKAIAGRRPARQRRGRHVEPRESLAAIDVPTRFAANDAEP